ncbi:HD domain-containing phosphohydrolase [Alicyclobacillus fastidiosus]|uniref:HD domain-containing phosphohydrolase n=1 Tax=Alicyclobacillus fastidiosus TaxID=392011 RepID=A0ABV5AB80_9BACL|nr:HD domain-containing phosphohydrolase [Alicyclobacillus fastidiosus]WEH10504.1 HD domain-containing protein [Alicyclobacillus fastidiosus]
MQTSDCSETWLHHVPAGDAVKRVSTRSTTVSLLAGRNGTEIIRHELAKGASWGMIPQDGWDELEAVYVISGRLNYSVGERQGVLQAGDTLSAEPVLNHVILQASEDSSFLYICSNYVFQHYSQETQDFYRLAVEIAEKDGYTASHCERLRHNALIIGERMNLSSPELFSLNCGAFFHDVGKINIPDEILLKPGRLTPDEFDIIKKHTIYGKEILTSTKIPYLVAGAIIAEQHHERYDGSGYPYGLKGDEISIGAAIVAVVDSYDAMTTNRPYQQSKTTEEAIKEIATLRGTLYHPEVVDVFLSVVGLFRNQSI